MNVGGHDESGYDAMLQRGNDLFDSDRKGALAAYYQVVTLQPDHVEAWNQIGRLMFDLGQYQEAELVFRRVEGLSRDQGLIDWAEMAAQNAALTRDTRQSMEPPAASEEQQSIDAINGIAQVSAPASSEPKPVVFDTPPPPVWQTTAPDTSLAPPPAAAVGPERSQPQLSNLRIEEMQVSSISEPIAPVAVQQQPPAAPPPQAAQPQPPQPQPPQPSYGFSPAATAPSMQQPYPAAPAQPMPPAQMYQQAPAANASHSGADPLQGHAQGLTPGQGHGQAHGLPALSRLDNLSAWPGPAAALVGAPATAANGGPHAGSQHPTQGQFTPQHPQAHRPPMQQQAPGQPYPGQPQSPQDHAAAMQRHHLPPLAQGPHGSQPVMGQRPQQTAPAEQEEAPRKGRAGRVALIGLGVLSAVGIGIGGALYLSGGAWTGNEVPVIKSDEKIASRDKAAAAEKAAEPVVAPAEPTPETADRDQAFTIGMDRLVNGKTDEGRKFLERAHSLGHAEASYNLASMYAKGDGVAQDFDKVVSYLNKSVEGGYAPAMTNLGLLYANGEGVEQDFAKARALWEKAAASEHPDAMHNLAVIYATGKGVDKNMPEAIGWYRKAVNAGFVESMANLGLIYANGDGVTRDFNEAKRLWELAAGKGHQISAQNLDKLNQILAQQPAKPMADQ